MLLLNVNVSFCVLHLTPPHNSLLKERRRMDETFNKFLELKRGAAMHTLESLMLLPVSIVLESSHCWHYLEMQSHVFVHFTTMLLILDSSHRSRELLTTIDFCATCLRSPQRTTQTTTTSDVLWLLWLRYAVVLGLPYMYMCMWMWLKECSKKAI